LESSPNLNHPPEPSALPGDALITKTGSVVEQVLLGRSLVIKGDLSAAEPLHIEGLVEGAIHAPGQRLTVGREGKVTANIVARELVIMGKVKGNIECAERLDIRREGSLEGDVVSGGIRVEDGAMLKGNIEVRRATTRKGKTLEQRNSPPDLSPAEQPGIVHSKAAAASAVASVTPVRGSKVLYQPEHKP